MTDDITERLVGVMLDPRIKAARAAIYPDDLQPSVGAVARMLAAADAVDPAATVGIDRALFESVCEERDALHAENARR